MTQDDESQANKYDQAVLGLLRRYGSAMESFGVASTGSSRGMEATMRLAQDAAREVISAALGREPTLEELEQLPPLCELPVFNVALKDLAKEEDDDQDPNH